MRIDGTLGIGAQKLSDQAAAAKAESKRSQPSSDAEVAGVNDPAAHLAGRYVAAARQVAPVDSQAVAEARRLIAEGLLDNSDAIARAAAAIATRAR